MYCVFENATFYVYVSTFGLLPGVLGVFFDAGKLLHGITDLLQPLLEREQWTWIAEQTCIMDQKENANVERLWFMKYAV